MQTIKEILSAAARLSPADLGKLCREIKRLDRLANAIMLKTSSQMTFRLYRQTDSDHRDSLRQSLAIEEDYGFYLQLHYSTKPGQELNFAQVYLTLKHLAGRTRRGLASCWTKAAEAVIGRYHGQNVYQGHRYYVWIGNGGMLRVGVTLTL